MEAMIYLVVRSCINWFRKLKEKPATAIALAVFVAFFLFSLVPAFLNTSAEASGNINALYIIILVLSLFFVISSLLGGLSNGTTFFSMSDVNIMFTAPISSTLILVYGIVRQMGRAMFLSVFMLFQISNLRTNFGLSVPKSLFIVFQYMILVFVSQLVTMTIYSFTNGNQLRKNIVKYTGIFLLIAYALFLAYGIYVKGLDTLQSFGVSLFPVAGWIIGIIISFINGNYILTLILMGVVILFAFALIFSIIKWKPDYYEDCLINSENTYHAKQFAKGDKTAAANIQKRKTVKNVKSMSFKGGNGASAIIYRHIIEIKRTNKFLILSLSSFLFLLLGIGSGFVAKNVSNVVVYVVIAFICYMSMFLAGITRLSQELSRQFIYLIPDSPFKKLLYASLSSIYSSLLNGILLLLPPVFISGFPVPQAIALLIAFTSVNCIFIATNIIMHAIFGKFSKSFMVFILYYIINIAILIPSFSIGILLSIFGFISLGLIFGSVVNFAISLLVLFLCRNMVNNIDFR